MLEASRDNFNTIEQPPQKKDRRAAWNDLANTPIQNLDDLYQVKRPAASNWRDYDIQQRRGFVEGFFGGVKQEEGYQPTIGEAVGAGLTEFIRSGVEVGLEFHPDVKRARESIETLRRINPEAAEEAERTFVLGEKLTDTQLALKGAAAVGEGLVMAIPFLGKAAVGVKAARAGKAAIAAKKAATAKKGITAGSVARDFATGGFYGALYSGMNALHTTDGDARAALRNAAIGGAIGAPLMGFGGVAIRATINAGSRAGKLMRSGVEILDANMPQWLRAPDNVIMKSIYNTIFTAGSNASRYFGEVGESFVRKNKKARQIASMDMGRLHLALIENGIIPPPSVSKKTFRHVKKYVYNREHNRILRGIGVYADPVLQAEAIANNPHLVYLDGLRKEYLAKGRGARLLLDFLNLDTYVPKLTADVPLKKKAIRALEKATTQAEREAIYAANDKFVREMVEVSVFDEKAFKTLEDSYKAYYDYVDFVHGGKRVLPENNTFLQKIVADGKARNINEAAGMVIEDLKYKKQTLTPLADSLDFQRKVDLPWYNPNPGETLPIYALDASARIAMAQTFGVKDEVITEMIGQISRDPSRGAKALEDARHFERLVRVITGQIEYSRDAIAISQQLRSIQTPKLAFAQILNVGQNLNYLLATDFGSTFHGLQTVFRDDVMRKAIEDGVLLNNFMREIYSYSGGGTKFADAMLKYSGFTWTEMFNRAVGSAISKRWATENFRAYIKQSGLLELDENEQKIISQMMLDKRARQGKIFSEDIATQEQNIGAFKKLYPKEDFHVSVGTTSLTQDKLADIKRVSATKEEKLKKTKSILEKDLLAESQPFTDQHVSDLQDTISFFQSEISQGKSAIVRSADGTIVPAPVYPDAEIGQAVELAVSMRRRQMEQILARLEDKYMETRAMGTMPRDIPTFSPMVDPTEQDLGQYIASIADEIKGVDMAILALQNETAEKTHLLESIINSYDIAEKKVRQSFPQGWAYDEFIEKKRRDHKRKVLSERAKELTEKNGGVTITLDGDIPENGFSFSRRKDIEFVKSIDEWTIDDVDSFMEKNHDALLEDNVFLGTWVEDDKVYTDVVTVFPDRIDALIEAKNADQLAIFDLENLETIYIKDNEDIISEAIRQRQRQGAVEGGIPTTAHQKGVIGGGGTPDGIRLTKPTVPKKPATPQEIALLELGIDIEEAGLRGFLSSDDLTIAAQTLVERTQFSGQAIDLPAFASSPAGKVVAQFRTFSYQQTRFLAHELKRDARTNPRRFFRTIFILGTIYPMTGEVLNNIRSLITQEKRPTEALDRYLSNLASAGGFGLAFDFFNAIGSGRIAEFAGGPTVTDGLTWLERVIAPTLAGDTDRAATNFTKQLLRQTGVGRIGVNTLFPPTRPGKSFYEELVEWSAD